MYRIQTNRVNGDRMSLASKVARKQLKRMGIDLSDQKGVTLRTINTLISTSVPNYISKKEMIEFLTKHIQRLKGE